MKQSAVNTLASYVEALRPIIYINHSDFHEVDAIIAQVAGENTLVIEFNNALGTLDFRDKHSLGKCTLQQFLEENIDYGFDQQTFLVLKDVHTLLEDREVIALLRRIAEFQLYNEDFRMTVFIVSDVLTIPKELESYITIFDLPVPTTREIVGIIQDYAKEQEITVAEDDVKDIALSLKGMNPFQIRQMLNLAYQHGGYINKSDHDLILEEKKQMIRKAGQLELINFKEDFENDIGGLEILRDWLRKKAKIFADLDRAIRFKVDIPKGIMIVGMPGCGKSLTAKATAGLFRLPLVRLDVGSLLGKYVGESEANMRRALKLAESISPCVLWIDEIEKAFSGVGQSGGGSDVTTRLFGQFLTWMQEKESAVFIVATANNISALPPEFLRKGRFDEIFFVDLPNEDERRQILTIHLKKRKKLNKDIDINALVKETQGFSGADLEAVVKQAVEEAFIEDKTRLTTEDLLASIKNTKSISVSMKDQIEAMRKAIEGKDIKSASKAETA